MGLEDYKDVVGTTAAVVTIAQFFSPVFICKKIIQQGNTVNVDPTPFIGGLGLSVLMLQHGLILNDPAMIPVNIFGFVLNAIYLAIYHWYADKKKRSDVFNKLGKIAIGAAVILGYARVDSGERLANNYGIIVTVLMLSLLGAPLLSLREIIRKQDTGSLPFPMIFCGTIVTFLWLLYGIILDNIFIKVQNAVGFALCVVQLSLFVLYPGKPKKSSKKTKSS